MHKHHGALRLLIILVGLVLLGLAVYLILVYGLQRAVNSTPSPSTTPTYFQVATSTRSGAAASSTTASTTVTTQEQGTGTLIVTNSDEGQTIQLSKNQQFVLQLGSSLNWNVTFTPADSITRVPNSPAAGGVQGTYEADKIGTTVMRATGAPICTKGEACPQFLLQVTVTFVVQ